MSQLRDMQTSELIAEGTPLEIVLVAQRLGPGEVLYDDVGLAFDPAAVLAIYQQSVDGSSDPAVREPERVAAALAGQAEQRMLAARDRLP